MHKWLIAALLAAVFAFAQGPSGNGASTGFAGLVKDAKTRVHELDIDGLRKLQASGEKFVLIDVREDNEWAAEHASGATHIGRGVLDRDIEAKVPNKSTKLVLYCAGGARSALAADAIMKMGYTDVLSLAGGMHAYKAAGLPVEK